MLEKTLALLQEVAPGSYVPESERVCYDEAEIGELAGALRKLVWAPSQVRKRLQALGVNITPCNFYSTIPSVAEIEAAFHDKSAPQYDCIFDHAAMTAFLDETLYPYSYEFDPPVAGGDGYNWSPRSFSFSDAMAYYCFIRHAKPRTIIEIGAGASTLIAAAACERNGGGRIICIDPVPPDFVRGIDRVSQLVTRPVQEIEPAFFNDLLSDGDIVFIDSTHTVKHGSDCLHLYLNVLPRLRPTVLVHVHDVYLPGTAPEGHLRDWQIYWTEQYLVMAYLIENRRATVLYGSAYHMERNAERLRAFMHGRYEAGGGSLWFRQSGTASP
jgi:predicted O-methyltransferase YrrM